MRRSCRSLILRAAPVEAGFRARAGSATHAPDSVERLERMRKLLLLGMLAGVVVLCSLNGCCRMRKGFVLRGDWSIELNRVPHLASHGPHYTCPRGCGECSPHLDTTGISPATDEPWEQLPAPSDPTALVPQRFLPVPTRPAFQPRYEGWYSQSLPESTTEESQTITLPTPEADDVPASDPYMPLPPQPNELRLRPLAAGHAKPDTDRKPSRQSAAAARKARQTAIPPKARTSMRPRSRP